MASPSLFRPAFFAANLRVGHARRLPHDFEDALRDAPRGLESVLAVEREQPNLFVLERTEPRLRPVHHSLEAIEHFALLGERAEQRTPTKLDGCRNAGRFCRADTAARERVRAEPRNPGKASAAFEQRRSGERNGFTGTAGAE